VGVGGEGLHCAKLALHYRDMAGPLPKLIIAAKYSQGCQGANDTRPNPAFLGCKFCSREMTSDIFIYFLVLCCQPNWGHYTVCGLGKYTRKRKNNSHS
jgi:hypothetical protein